MGVVDARGQVLSQIVIRSDNHSDAESYLDEVAVALNKIIAEAGVEGQIRGIGIGAPNGNYYTGMVEMAPNLEWAKTRAVPVAEMLSARMKGIPVALTNDANAAAAENAKNAKVLIAAENARVEEARRVAAAKIEELQNQIRTCIQALERIKEANVPAPAGSKAPAFDFDSENKADAVADEIAHNLEALVGSTVDAAPKAEPKHPTNDTTTSKFANLQFGRNYDPNHK